MLLAQHDVGCCQRQEVRNINGTYIKNALLNSGPASGPLEWAGYQSPTGQDIESDIAKKVGRTDGPIFSDKRQLSESDRIVGQRSARRRK